MFVADIRSLVLARDDVTLRYCGVAYIVVGIVDAMQIMSSAIFTHGLSQRPSSLAWTRELKSEMQCSFLEHCSTFKPLSRVWCMSQA